MSYKREAIKGVSWIGILRLLIKVVGFAEAIILARILLPDQFGAYGVALLALGLLEVLTETGVNIVLIQEDDVDEYISSAWVVSILRGLVIMLVLLVISPLIAGFFHSSLSLQLLYLISLVPLLRGFINPAVVKLQKDLQFSKEFYYRLAILSVDTVVSITLCVVTKSPIGIVIGLIAGVVIEVLLSYIIVKPVPKLSFKKHYVSRLFHRGKWITGTSIFNYLFFNLDNIVVGRLLGASQLGIYQMAYSMSVAPLTELSNVFIHVTFPIFTRLSTDRIRLRSGFFKSILFVSLLSLPAVMVLVFLPGIFIYILGQRWSEVVYILPILGILGLSKSVLGFSTSLFLSEKKQSYATVTSLVNIVGLTIPIVPLVSHFGTFGAALSACIGALIALPLYVYYIMKIFDSPRQL